ncbi:hypothetical protein HPB47_014279 [Ixodes persulcatus]|uniref:Uncharacterized protein n=1 Tax=Ixodes persulcatus TaxID=34615 RepID=A0AC60QX94_IXOPE|nr:hypothetical protein HPB47_014279 [Ixodes persulcatus]
MEDTRLNTIGQATNDPWFRDRVGKLTSTFKKAVRCGKPECIVRQIMYLKPSRDLPASDTRDYGGPSPDGILYRWGEQGLLEVKCPQSKEIPNARGSLC